ncbi:MAG: hypothetical protein M1819_002179 [Sarea resinae]|nr:MAG: hypothetical protein M1819_002179 [Sarea resinae]
MKFSLAVACLVTLNSFCLAWLPSEKVRGVNLGGLFIIEPWMMEDEWNSMGCSNSKSEFDCVMALGQDAADAAFQKHWSTWITEDDIQQIANLGLNTLRIPIGYWMKEDLVSESEYFPRGAFEYLERVCGWAKTYDLYVILGLHGSPGSQEPEQPFTGQYASSPEFYSDYNYGRAYEWLELMTNASHTNSNFSTVGAIEIINEPLQNADEVSTMVSTYYPEAYNTIRQTELALGISYSQQLHVQMMDSNWGSGNPTASLLADVTNTLFDDHAYVKYTPNVALSREGYMQYSCTNRRTDNSPLIVGEWSLSPADSVQWDSDFTLWASDAVEWYGKWFSAQAYSYEQDLGWIFWNWKVQNIGGVNDWRWGYQQAVTAGAIPTNAAQAADASVCAGYL